MKYAKAALTFEQQAGKLLGRGLVADRSALINRLKAVNYYRLSGYLYPFRNPDDTFRSGTTLDAVWQRYTFDRQLRLLALDGIERVEVCVRTALVYHHAHKHGPFGYTVPANLPKLPAHRFGRFLTTVHKETQLTPCNGSISDENWPGSAKHMKTTQMARAVPCGTTPLHLLHVADALNPVSGIRRRAVKDWVRVPGEKHA